MPSVRASRSTAAAGAELLARWCTGYDAPRILAFAAHPDDDVLGFGGRMRLFASGIHVAYVSNGAPARPDYYPHLGFTSQAEYANARRDEARRALQLANIPSAQVHELGGNDQGIVHDLIRLVRSARTLIEEVAPAAILTHAYEGGHPDHDATACLVHAAVRLMESDGLVAPALLEHTSYHQRGQALVWGDFLPPAESEVRTVELDEASRALKRRMLECYATQADFLSSFPLSVERFRLAPTYDFTRPAAAPCFYDQVDWGVSCAEFLLYVQAGLSALGITEPC